MTVVTVVRQGASGDSGDSGTSDDSGTSGDQWCDSGDSGDSGNSGNSGDGGTVVTVVTGDSGGTYVVDDDCLDFSEVEMTKPCRIFNPSFCYSMSLLKFVSYQRSTDRRSATSPFASFFLRFFDSVENFRPEN
jgi:hypothetical protein